MALSSVASPTDTKRWWRPLVNRPHDDSVDIRAAVAGFSRVEMLAGEPEVPPGRIGGYRAAAQACK